ncbi:phage regulatory protein/antirepressor Ant [Massilia rhizosphaerae]|uniref:phage regulatory protein/antirepressor Ant n=1 Tax=Massilia rhizosphaerae TaxID=2784389 RepID=UPI0018DB232A|nr:phage regulatory protein/antirepressor Ant [Massilia rhizosphaerae]
MNAPQQAVPTLTSTGLVIVHGDELVTTTTAIASGTANTHEAVIKLVRTHQKDFEEFGRVRFEIEPFETAGGQQKREIALLNEDQATLLITYMRNNMIVRQFKIALVRAFSEMRKELAARAMSNTPNFDDPIAMAEAWIAAKKEERAQSARAEQLEHQVAALAPAAAALERIADVDEAFCITDAAKHLQIGPHKLRDFLLQKKWMYPRTGKGGYVAYQPQIHSGNLVHKYGNYQDPETGERKQSAQVLVTSKGITKLAEMLGTPQPQQQGRLIQ